MKKLFLMLVVILLSVAGFAQDAAPRTPFDVIDKNGVDLGNLSFNFTVPIVDRAGRGLPFSFSIPLTTNGPTHGVDGLGGGDRWKQSGTNFGSIGGVGPLGYGHISSSSTITGHFCVDHYLLYTNNFKYRAPDNSDHNFPAAYYEDNTCGFAPTYSQTGPTTAVDGSGFVLIVQGGKVRSVNGSVFDSATNKITDSNGNQITANFNGTVYTDTLGNTVLSISNILGYTNGSPTVFTYYAPDGTPRNIQINFSSTNFRTAYGCAGIAESTSGVNPYHVSSIHYPDGAQYVFAYETTPGYPSNTTDRLSSITLPTGGAISIAYLGANDGITCPTPVGGHGADAVASLTNVSVTNLGGTWNYARSLINNQWQTVVTDPAANSNTYFFRDTLPTQAVLLNGSIIDICYNGNPAPCKNTAFSLPITQKEATTTLPSGQKSKVVSFLNSCGLPTETDIYDFGPTLVNKTITTYASLGNGIVNGPSEIIVKNSSNITVKDTVFAYDEGTPVATSGTPQHVSITGSRGNPTTVSSWVSGSTFLTSHSTYYDTGNVLVATAPNNSTATFDYANGCGNSFPTTVTRGAGLVSYASYNCTGGVAVSHTNENGGVSSTAYTDANFWRPTSTTDELGNQTIISYLYAGSNPTGIDTSLTFDGGNGNAISNSRTFLDSYGRTKLVQSRQGPSSSSYSTVESDFDSRGLVTKTTNPYTGTYGQLNGSIAGTVNTYDGLGRVATTTGPGGDILTISRAATEDNDTLASLNAPTGENAKVKNVEVDGLGRTTSVCEVTTLSGSGNCGQHTPKTGYLTSQSYDALSRATSITQGAQTRSATYDGLNRVLSSSTPEAGTVYATYDSASGCTGTSNGSLIKTVDANGNTVCNQYDSLGRLIAVTYSGTDSSRTPEKHFVYDSAVVDGFTMTYTAGKLAEQYTGPSNAKITDEGFSYDQQGNLTTLYQMTPYAGGANSGWYVSSVNFYPNHSLKNLISSLGTIQYTYDSRGRGYSVVKNPGSFSTTLVSSTTYDTATSALQQVMYGNGDHDDFTYDSTSLRMTMFGATIGGTPHSQTGTLNWNANGSVQSLVLTDWFNSANAQTCNYTADDLMRIASVDCGASKWQQNFTYDRYGNLTKTVPSGGTGVNFNPTYSTSTNRMTGGYTYNSNGDLLTDGIHTYTWDAENRPASIDGVLLTKNASNQEVEQNNAGVYTEIQYTPLGRFGLMTGQAIKKLNIALFGGGIAEQTSIVNVMHPDNLGSSRITSTFTGRAMAFDTAFAPFGETYASSGTTDRLFTGHRQGTVSGLYDTENRENDPSEGRWVSPDPVAGSIGNPQELNRYAYVMNNPLTSTDPLGLKGDRSNLDGGYALLEKWAANNGWGGCQGWRNGRFTGEAQRNRRDELDALTDSTVAEANAAAYSRFMASGAIVPATDLIGMAPFGSLNFIGGGAKSFFSSRLWTEESGNIIWDHIGFQTERSTGTSELDATANALQLAVDGYKFDGLLEGAMKQQKAADLFEHLLERAQWNVDMAEQSANINAMRPVYDFSPLPRSPVWNTPTFQIFNPKYKGFTLIRGGNPIDPRDLGAH